MKIINNYSLPKPLVEAVSKIYPPKEKRLSVTALIGSPKERYLKMKHWDDLKSDASDRLFALLGTACHKAIESYRGANVLTEFKLEHKIGDWTIAGICDLYDNATISDWKVTSVFAYLLGSKKEWENQLNVYGYLFHKIKLPVEKLRIEMILRDWNRNKIYENKYPEIPFVGVDVPLWSFKEMEEYIHERLALFNDAENYVCTDTDCWARPTKYAVMEKGKKRAKRVLDTFEEAEGWLEEKGNGKCFIVKRLGEKVKCESFCDVRDFCPQYLAQKSS